MLTGEVGFIIKGEFFSNKGLGHEANARKIIQQNGWLNEWNNGSAQDFIVCKKRAIQVGSGCFPNRLIACSSFYDSKELDKVVKKWGLNVQKYDLIY